MKKLLSLELPSVPRLHFRSLVKKRETYFVILGFLILGVLSLGFRGYTLMQNLSLLRSQYDDFEFVLEKQVEGKEREDAYRERLISSDPHYLNFSLEKQIPFESELVLLEDVAKFAAFRGYQPIQERIGAIEKGLGQMRLIEKNRQLRSGFAEARFLLENPILVNRSNVEKIISGVEGVCIGDKVPLPGRPDIVFRRFSLNPTRDNQQREAFALDFELIKRDIPVETK